MIARCRNIVSGGPSIIRKPGAYRSNLELTNSLRSNFLAAQEDYADQPFTNGGANGDSNGHGIENGNGHSDDFVNSAKNGRTPVSAWTAREGNTVYIPRIDWDAAGLQEEPSQYEVTVKLFFLPTASIKERARYTSEALDLVMKELRIGQVDLLIVSFPGMSFEGDCEWEADKINAAQGDDEEEFVTWAILEPLHKQGLVKNLGVAEFGTEKLSRLLQRTCVRPAVDQINIKNCCSVPPPLAKLAKEQGIELLVHSDCTNILPKGTLRELLGSGFQGAGVLCDPEDPNGAHNGVDCLHGDLTPQWVVKYTAVVRDRGVIENKGYFAGAELHEE